MKKNTMPYAYFSGQITPVEEAKVSIASNSLQYGTTCFAGIRGYLRNGHIRIFRLEDHYQRLMNAAKIMGMNAAFSFQEFRKIIVELTEANAPQSDFYIRPFIYTPDEQLSPKADGLKFELAIYMVPLGQYYDQSKGLRMMVSSWRKFSDASMPTKAKAGGCYVNSFLATGEAIRCGYDEALMMDESGFIVEASVANILVVYRDRIVMPEVGSAMLEGITMRTVVDLLKSEGIAVHFEKIDRSMIYTCDELILMGTGAQITFAGTVDDRVIGQHGKSAGSICTLLRERFSAILSGDHPQTKHWITELTSQTNKVSHAYTTTA